MDQQKVIGLFNLYTSHVRGELDSDGVTRQLRALCDTHWLDELVVIGVGFLLDQIDEKSPKHALKYRLLNMEAARMIDLPVARGNSAFSAARTALLVEHDPLQSAQLQVEAIRSYITIRNNPQVPPNFRNLQRLFENEVTAHPDEFERVLSDLLGILGTLVIEHWDCDMIAECAMPTVGCLASLATVTAESHLYSRAWQQFTDVILPSLPREHQARINYLLASALGLKGDVTSETLFTRAIQIADQEGDWVTSTEARIGLAGRELANTRVDIAKRAMKAWEIGQQAGTFAERSGDPRLLAKVDVFKVDTALMLHENLDSIGPLHAEAVAAGERALSYHGANGDPLERFNLLTKLIFICSDLKFLGFVEEALAIIEPLRPIEPGMVINILPGILRAYRETREPALLDRARELVKAAEQTLDILESDKDESNHFIRFSLLVKRMELEDKAGDMNAALEMAQKAHAAITGLSPTDEVDALLYVAVQLSNQERFDQAMLYFERAANLADEVWLDAANKTGDSPAAKVRSHLYTLSGYFKRLYGIASATSQVRGRAKDAILWLERGRGRVYTQILGARKGVCTALPKERVADLLDRLIAKHPDTLFLQFHLQYGPPTCFAWSAEQEPEPILLPEECWSQIVHLAGTQYESEMPFWEYYHRWRRTGAQGHYRRWLAVVETLANAIGKSIFSPILENVDTKMIKRLAIVPDAWLSAIPIQIACLAPGDYLLDHFDLIQAPSLLSLELLPPPRNGKASLVVSGGHADLDWAEREVVEVRRILASSGWTASEGAPTHISSLSRLADSLRDPQLGIIHIASHMHYVPGRTSDSQIRIAISNNGQAEAGNLTLEEILAGEPVPIPFGSTVLLSGCESSVVDFGMHGDPISLGSAMLLAGARAVVASSWAVDDVASFYLMQRLYRNWVAKESNDLAGALCASQRWLRQQTAQQLANMLETDESRQYFEARFPKADSRPFDHPYFWAVWNHIGAP